MAAVSRVRCGSSSSSSSVLPRLSLDRRRNVRWGWLARSSCGHLLTALVVIVAAAVMPMRMMWNRTTFLQRGTTRQPQQYYSSHSSHPWARLSFGMVDAFRPASLVVLGRPITTSTATTPTATRRTLWEPHQQPHYPRPYYSVAGSARTASFSVIRSKKLDSTTIVLDDDDKTDDFLHASSSLSSPPHRSDDRVLLSSPILQDLNANQIRAVTQPHEAIVRVMAGPGSGKTRVLTSRIAWLLLQQPQQHEDHNILGVTFTRKAAGEMQQRLHKLLTLQQQPQPQSTDSERPDTTTDALVVPVEAAANGEASTNTPAGMERVTLGTFHSVCATILRWNGNLLATLPSVVEDLKGVGSNSNGLTGTFNIVDTTEQLRLLKDVLKELQLDTTMDQYNIKPNLVLNKVLWCKSQLAHGEQPFPTPWSKGSAPRPIDIATKVYYRYRQMMLSTNCIDFDDLILLTRELLLQHTDVRERLQRRWKHVLVDEFQDTSRTQLDLIKLLTSTSLFVVGDADQSIYSWRGAHVGSMAEFAQEFAGYGQRNNGDDQDGGIATIYLMENYRSTSSIVKAAQKMISASSGDSSGADKLRQAMIPQRDKGQPPRIVACNDAQEEATFVVSDVHTKINAGAFGPDHTIAFIYRTNAQSRALEEACVKQNLPYVIFGTATSFYKRQEIKDCLCFLRWLYNGNDRSSMLRALTTPKRGIGDKAIAEFDEYCVLVGQLWEERSPSARKPSPLEVLYYLSGDESWVAWDQAEFPPPSLTFSTRPMNLLAEFSRNMRSLREKANEAPVEDVLSFIVEEMQLISHLDKISKSKDEFFERKANVDELKQASRRYSSEGACLPIGAANANVTAEMDEYIETPLGKFLDDVALVTEMADNAKRSTEKRHVANMMTIHGSKGMEFDTVYLVGMEDGTLPAEQALQQEDKNPVAIEEERRVCYVAMTRAKSELLMSWRKEVPVFTSQGIRYVTKSRSRFLDALVSKKGSVEKSGNAKHQLPRQTQPPPVRQQYGSSIPSNRKYSTASTATRNKPPFSPSKSAMPFNRSFSSTNSAYRNKPAYSPSTTVTTSPKPRKLTGTAEVYSRQPPKVISRTERKVNLQPEERVRTKKRVIDSEKPKAVVPRTVDPSWFFPIGSKVIHQQLGEGLVLPANSSDQKDEKRDVLVRFGNGEVRYFSLHGTDISPIV